MVQPSSASSLSVARTQSRNEQGSPSAGAVSPSPSRVPTLAEVQSLTSVAQIEAALQLLGEREREVDTRLDELLGSRDRLERRMELLRDLVPKIHLLRNDSRQLNSTIAFTCHLAENVSSKVRELDVAQSNVQAATKVVDDIADLKSCIEGVRSAMRRADYETVAGHIHRFLSFDEKVLRGNAEISAEVAEDESEGPPLEVLRKYQGELEAIVRERFDEAIREGDRAAVDRFLKLFPLINLHQEAIKKFSKYLCGLVALAAEKALSDAFHTTNTNRETVFVDLLTALFETVARVIDENQPVVETHFGPGSMLPVVQQVQRECDRQARIVLDRFKAERRLAMQVHEAQAIISARKVINLPVPSAGGSSGAGAGAAQAPDPAKAADILLTEIGLLNSRTELYGRFIRRRVAADLAVLDAEAKAAPTTDDKGHAATRVSGANAHGRPDGRLHFLPVEIGQFRRIVDDSELSKALQEIMGQYIVLEQSFMKLSIAKAVRVESYDAGATTSSLVDDVFFVLKKVTRRAVATGSIDCLCAMINHANGTLQSELAPILQERLRHSQGDLKDLFTGRLTSDTGRNSYTVALNNAETATEYTVKLMRALESEATAAYAHAGDRERAKLQSCLNDLAATSEVFRQLVEAGMGGFCANAVDPKIAPLVDAFVTIGYNIDETEFAARDASDPFVVPIVRAIDATLSQIKPTLTPGNYDTLVAVMCEHLAGGLEGAVFQTAFNQLGGLQLDKDLRTLSSFISGMTQRTIRDKFTRLTQIATLLVLEKVSDTSEYWSTQISWRLTPTEVRRVLALRVDFRSDDINRLKL